MRRVDKLNKAIEILHIQHGLNARQIQSYLRDRNLFLDLEVITDVVLDINYQPVTIPKKSRQTLRCERLNAVLKQVVPLHKEGHCPWRYMSSMLDEVGITMPGSGVRFNSLNIQKYLKSHSLHIKIGNRAHYRQGLTYREYCAKLEEQIQQLRDYQSWIQEGN